MRRGEAALKRQLPRSAHVQADAQARPVPAEGTAVAPQGRPGSAGSLVKRGLQDELDRIAQAHPGCRLTLWFQDEARFGQKGRTCHQWFIRGQRPSGLCDQRYTWTHLFAAVQPKTGEAFALVLPDLNTATMQLFLDRFAATLAPDEHAAMVMDQAGWHITDDLAVPTNVSLILLPSYSPRTEPSRTRLAVPAGALSQPQATRQLRRHCRRTLHRLEQNQPSTNGIPYQLPIPQPSQILGRPV